VETKPEPDPERFSVAEPEPKCIPDPIFDPDFDPEPKQNGMKKVKKSKNQI
jgi:hypothetical protein